jgi:hypothetical protein
MGPSSQPEVDDTLINEAESAHPSVVDQPLVNRIKARHLEAQELAP